MHASLQKKLQGSANSAIQYHQATSHQYNLEPPGYRLPATGGRTSLLPSTGVPVSKTSSRKMVEWVVLL